MSEITAAKALWEIRLSDWFWVVVDEGECPVRTLIKHCPDWIDPDEFPDYCYEDWGDDLSDEEILDNLAATFQGHQTIEGEFGLCYSEAERLGLLPEDLDPEEYHLWGPPVPVAVEALLRVVDHGYMLGERWAD